MLINEKELKYIINESVKRILSERATDVPCFIYTNKNDFDKQRNSVDINELYRAYGCIFN